VSAIRHRVQRIQNPAPRRTQSRPPKPTNGLSGDAPIPAFARSAQSSGLPYEHRPQRAAIPQHPNHAAHFPDIAIPLRPPGLRSGHPPRSPQPAPRCLLGVSRPPPYHTAIRCIAAPTLPPISPTRLSCVLLAVCLTITGDRHCATPVPTAPTATTRKPRVPEEPVSHGIARRRPFISTLEDAPPRTIGEDPTNSRPGCGPCFFFADSAPRQSFSPTCHDQPPCSCSTIGAHTRRHRGLSGKMVALVRAMPCASNPSRIRPTAHRPGDPHHPWSTLLDYSRPIDAALRGGEHRPPITHTPHPKPIAHHRRSDPHARQAL